MTLVILLALLGLRDQPPVGPAKRRFHPFGSHENVGVAANLEGHFAHAHEAGVEAEDVELPSGIA